MWQHPLPLLGFLQWLLGSGDMRPIVLVALQCILLVLISLCISIVIVVSRGPGSYICIFCGGSDWSVTIDCAGVSTSLQGVRTGERCEQAYAT
jgi:hypothetical protein